MAATNEAFQDPSFSELDLSEFTEEEKVSILAVMHKATVSITAIVFSCIELLSQLSFVTTNFVKEPDWVTLGQYNFIEDPSHL